MSHRRSVQLAAASVAHGIRGDLTAAAELIDEISNDPNAAIDAFTRMCLVTGAALAIREHKPLAEALETVAPVDVAPLPEAPVLRRSAIGYVVALAGGDQLRAAATSEAFGDAGTALNSLFNLAAAIVHALASLGDAAGMAAGIAQVMAVSTPEIPSTGQPGD
jgi:hypothetical protein